MLSCITRANPNGVVLAPPHPHHAIFLTVYSDDDKPVAVVREVAHKIDLLGTSAYVMRLHIFTRK
jgi:hypothetical protein